MPYGLPKNLDNESNNKWMESCVTSVMSRSKGMEKGSAIAICKKQLISKKGDKSKANIAVINEMLENFSEDRRSK